MKERPILFSGEMVRAILEGRKTQTRRLVMPMPAYPDAFKGVRMEFNSSRCGVDIWNCSGTLPAHFWKCPFGKPGDRLWVRETLQLIEADDEEWAWGYAADGELISFDRVNDTTLPFAEPLQKWPSIHMPRWASRITLEVVSVKVERLQDISEADAIAEGVDYCSEFNHDECKYGSYGYQCAFERLWDSIYGKKPGCSWIDNPWVWACEFKVVQP